MLVVDLTLPIPLIKINKTAHFNGRNALGTFYWRLLLKSCDWHVVTRSVLWIIYSPKYMCCYFWFCKFTNFRGIFSQKWDHYKNAAGYSYPPTWPKVICKYTETFLDQMVSVSTVQRDRKQQKTKTLQKSRIIINLILSVQNRVLMPMFF